MSPPKDQETQQQWAVGLFPVRVSSSLCCCVTSDKSQNSRLETSCQCIYVIVENIIGKQCNLVHFHVRKFIFCAHADKGNGAVYFRL